MPRGLSAAAKSYQGPVTWLADITTRQGTMHHFGEDARAFGGNSYLPYLRLAQGSRFTRALAADFGEIELINSDLVVGTLLQTEDFEGALCELRQLLVGLDAAPLILRGRLTEQEETDHAIRFRIVSELDPAQIQLHARAYSGLCTWPFRRGLCGSLDSGFSFTESLAERTTASAGIQSITDATLAMTTDEHKDRYVLLTVGTGRGQLRRIRSNTATTLTVWTPWTTTPDTSTKFKVFTFTAGASKPLWTSSSAVLQSASATTTLAAGGRTVTDTALAMTTDEHKGELLWWFADPVGSKLRKIKSNTATAITIEDDEPDINTSGEPFDRFAVRFRRCPKDFLACEPRARTEAHNGFPTLVPLVAQSLGEPPVIPPDFFPPGSGGGFGGGGAIPL
ncbi:MAG: hypothetical protein L0212_03095 [Acidobacteria bacterium]|nr:hypothetical protein [Acidobacteriota bacterium]